MKYVFSFFINQLQRDGDSGDESHSTARLDRREIGTYIYIYEKGVFLKKSGRFDSIEKLNRMKNRGTT